MIYISKMVLVDENGQEIYKITNKKATDGINMALKIIEAKDGINPIKKIIVIWDEQYKKLFGICDKNAK